MLPPTLADPAVSKELDAVETSLAARGLATVLQKMGRTDCSSVGTFSWDAFALAYSSPAIAELQAQRTDGAAPCST